ncbi:DUF2849 domain-containing protein [Temperatibacter marinus]|uniref:DUF2849 domain-containing protein n=1 Tax=Temperatibacter marinus TaxID=1456591 RepID=A0AA52EFE5_9PROT|nr:DUF2849 domain-containing protein [Temperatibacter marinus]WND01527.1 DUF2849 domain-containing protein [Temperatibacter marinus]
MAKKSEGPQIIIANRLDDGRVVFLSKAGGWSVTLNNAVQADNPEQLKALLETAVKSVDANIIVSPEPIDAALSGGGAFFEPSHIKYKIQSQGPTVRPDLGYQAADIKQAGTA